MTRAADPRIETRREGTTAILTINRPEKLNALDDAMVDALHDQIRALDRATDVSIVIITGAGEKAFSAGGDVDAWRSRSPAHFSRFWVRDGHSAFDAIARLRQPVIAVLNGVALGGGLELAAAADYRIAETHARIGQPETGLGVIPGWSGTQRAVRRFGAQLVRRMALFGEVYDAQTALDLGLVDGVSDTGRGMADALALADRVAARGQQATELTKMLINAAEGEERERVLEALAGHVAAGSDELRDRLQAIWKKP